MAYLNNIPNANDILAISQGQIKENFSQLQTQFSVDHDSLLAGGATGKHFKLTMPEQSSDPTTGADEGVLYTKDSGTETDLYYRTENNGLIRKISNMINAYVVFTGATGVVVDSHNVSSVTRSAAGRYVVNFPAGTFTNTNYIPAGMIKTIPGEEGAAINEEASIARTTTTFPCVAAASGALIFDPTTVYLIFVGGR